MMYNEKSTVYNAQMHNLEPTAALRPDPARVMRLYLINPSNPLVSIIDAGKNRWNRCRVWKPLGLMVIAGLTPEDWEITIIDENMDVPDYSSMPGPDLVGITAFTSQAVRAYELAAQFRQKSVPVVLGGIHATMCRDEAAKYVDAIVSGEAERVWGNVLEDVRHNCLKPLYEGGLADMKEIPSARHDLLKGKYAFGSIQTTRGCPLNCNFCSVTSFNGARFRQRPIDQIIREFQQVPEKHVLIVDDNLIGTRREHFKRAKDLFRAMIQADLKKNWVGQSTINVANDDELLSLAAAAGCKGLFIGFESPEPDGVREISGKNKLCRSDELANAVKHIQAHGIIVAGSFIIGFDSDKPGIGKRIADTADHYGVDFVNVLFLTPLPGTRLWDDFDSQNRITIRDFPENWKYYTLTYPVVRYKNLTPDEAIVEMNLCSKRFYTLPKMLRRLWHNMRHGQSLVIGLAGGYSYWKNIQIEHRKLVDFSSYFGLMDSKEDNRDKQQASATNSVLRVEN